jgi:predicted TIM-barrel fold metal-dependent hydrolase
VDIRRKLEEMDNAGIELSLLSLSLPGPDNGGADSDRLARLANDGIAEVVTAFPGRFRGIANLGLGSIEASVLK